MHKHANIVHKHEKLQTFMLQSIAVNAIIPVVLNLKHDLCCQRSMSACVYAGFEVPASVAQTLRDGKFSQLLDSWLSVMLQSDVSTELASYMKLLQACNESIEFVEVTGCEAALYNLGSSCLNTSSGSSKDSVSESAPGEPSMRDTSRQDLQLKVRLIPHKVKQSLPSGDHS